MSTESTPQELLELAAAATYERIRADRERISADRERISGPVKKVLDYMIRHLFDQGLNVRRLRAECGIRDNSFPIYFHSIVGRPPHAYLTLRRLETGLRLLHDSDLPIWKISEMLGFSSLQVFSRAFMRWRGHRPARYRRDLRQLRAARAAPAPRARKAPSKGETQVYWQRALSGQLDNEEAARLMQRLLEIYPPRRHPEG